MGQIPNHVPTTLRKAYSHLLTLQKIKVYRKFNIKLKERSGEILFNPKNKNQNRVCGCVKRRIDKEMPVSVQFDASNGVARY